MEPKTQTLSFANFREPREFRDCYLKYCERHNISTPTKFLANQTNSAKLALNADRMKVVDWEAVFSALQKENSLKSISIASEKNKRDWLKMVDQTATTEFAASSVKGPPIFTHYILEKLVVSVIKALLRKESSCERLHLELPLSPSYCRLFSQVFYGKQQVFLQQYKNNTEQGIPGAMKLRHLSLKGSCIGDEGCRYICDALKSLPNIRELDLTGCNLGIQSIEKIIDLLKSHSLILSTLAWESSFRYRAPQISSSMGLTRLTLNKNPNIGDEGSRRLTEALKDDISIRAIDLQGCKITNDGGTVLLGLLMHNKNLQVLDVRGNKISFYVLDSITRALQSEERVAKAKKSDIIPVEWLPLI